MDGDSVTPEVAAHGGDAVMRGGDVSWLHMIDTTGAREVSEFGAVGISAVALGEGQDPWTATVLVCDPGGALAAHVAGRDQVFLPIEGRGWLEIDGMRREIEPGAYGVIRAGQLHAKGAITRFVVLVLQSPTITGVARLDADKAEGVAPSATPSASSGSDDRSPGATSL